MLRPALHEASAERPVVAAAGHGKETDRRQRAGVADARQMGFLLLERDQRLPQERLRFLVDPEARARDAGDRRVGGAFLGDGVEPEGRRAGSKQQEQKAGRRQLPRTERTTGETALPVDGHAPAYSW